MYCRDRATGKQQWRFQILGPIASSPAVGDVDGDGALEIVFGSEDWKVYGLSAGGGLEWSYISQGPVNGTPALVDRANLTPFQAEAPMFQQDMARTGTYPVSGKALWVYVSSDDGYLYLLTGKGKFRDRYQTPVNPSTNLPAGINCAPAVGDLDGDGRHEILFKAGTSLIALRDLALLSPFDVRAGSS